MDFSQFRSLGFVAPMARRCRRRRGKSLHAGGASGPAFLITDNFEVIRQYNTSDAYALAVAILADRIGGATTPSTPWPRVTPLTTAQCKELQQGLTRLGFYRGTIDGKLGRVARNAVHAFQLNVGMQPADGLATKAVLERLRGA